MKSFLLLPNNFVWASTYWEQEKDNSKKQKDIGITDVIVKAQFQTKIIHKGELHVKSINYKFETSTT